MGCGVGNRYTLSRYGRVRHARRSGGVSYPSRAAWPPVVPCGADDRDRGAARAIIAAVGVPRAARQHRTYAMSIDLESTLQADAASIRVALLPVPLLLPARVVSMYGALNRTSACTPAQSCHS